MKPRVLAPLDPRPPVWDANRLAPRLCPLCGDEGSESYVRPDDLVIRACAVCGTYFVSPAPDTSQLEELYSRYHDRHRVDAWRGTAWHEKSTLPTLREPAALAARIRRTRPLADSRVVEIASHVPLRGARVLDVGCGLGALLFGLRDLGAEVHGIDLDPAAVDFARGELGLSGVERGTLDGVDGEYDLVVLQDVLEHVLDPRATMERAARLLGPGGVLYVWTPNAASAALDPEPLLFRIDYEHLQFLQPRTLARLARELGLDLVHLESLGWLSLRESDANPRAPRRATLRRRILGLPGVRGLNRIRASLRGGSDERAGSYHLFALLRRADGHYRSPRDPSE